MKSGKSLKSANQGKLIAFVVANTVALAVLLIGVTKTSELIKTIGQGDYLILARAIAVPALGGLVLGAFGWIVPKTWKEALVSWRIGPGRLPSSRAFSAIAPADLRIDMDALTACLGPLPQDPHKQSALWYATYRKHSNEAAVNDANSAYLLYRDMVALMPVLFVAVLLTNVVAELSAVNAMLALSGTLIEYLLLMLAGRHAGTRLVSNVLAIEAATQDEAKQSPAAKRAQA